MKIKTKQYTEFEYKLDFYNTYIQYFNQKLEWDMVLNRKYGMFKHEIDETEEMIKKLEKNRI